MMHDHKERESLDEATLFAQSGQNLISVGLIETVQGVYGEVRYRLREGTLPIANDTPTVDAHTPAAPGRSSAVPALKT